MGYLIRYDPERDKRYPLHRSSVHMPVLIACLVLLTVVVLIAASRTLSMVLIPGDPSVTVMAFDEMLLNLQNGEPILDAVTAFCDQITVGAGLAG